MQFILAFFVYFYLLCGSIFHNSFVLVEMERIVPEMKELRTIIRDLREDKDLKQKTIAAYLSVSQQTYSNYENGNREIPLWAILKLSEYYKVSTDYLLGIDAGYAGNTNLNGTYLDDITLHDVMYDIQQLNTKNRHDLLRYIRFLKTED